MIKIVIAESQDLTRGNLKQIIERDSSIKVIGCVKDGREAFILCDQMQPDLVLMDLSMPDCDGIETIKTIRKKHQGIKIIILASAWNGDQITGALRNGVDGCLFKDVHSKKLITGIKSVVNGLKVIDKELYKMISNNYSIDHNTVESAWLNENIYQNKLTDKQLAILGFLAEGYKEEAVAAEIGLSINTVKYHKRKIFDKLEVECTNEALVKAIRMNLISERANVTVYVC